MAQTQTFPGASHFSIMGPIFSNGPLPQFLSPDRAPSEKSHEASLTAQKDHKSRILWREGEVYARFLLPLGRGFPLWKPKARDSRLPDAYRQDGVHIGDVGILNEFNGFDCLFNACHPEDHPLNARGVPHDFKQLLDIDYNDIVDEPEEFKFGSYVPSRSSEISKTTLSEEEHIQGVPAQVGSGLDFTSSASQGAFLVLPEGGRRIDHNQLGKFLQYSQECARSWYDHFNGPKARGISNGAIYLITGFDKARAWGVASFVNADVGSVRLQFVPLANAGNKPTYWFRTCNAALSSADCDSEFEKISGSVFLRGFKIAIRNNPFATNLDLSTKVTYLSDLDADELLRKPTGAPLRAESFPTAAEDVQQHQPDDPDWDDLSDIYPRRHQVYHPSDVINEWILSTYPEVDVAVTHDDDWAAVIQDNEDKIPDDQELVVRIKKYLKLVRSNGHTYASFEIVKQHSSSVLDTLNVPLAIRNVGRDGSGPVAIGSSSLPRSSVPRPYPDLEGPPSANVPVTEVVASAAPSASAVPKLRRFFAAASKHEPSITPLVSPMAPVYQRMPSSRHDLDLKVRPSNAPVIDVVDNAAPSASAIPKIIKGNFFAGASNLEFHGEDDYNQIAGDYVEDVYADDASFDTEDNPESVKQGQTKGKAPARPFPTGPTPELAPGTVVEGELFAGAQYRRMPSPRLDSDLKVRPSNAPVIDVVVNAAPSASAIPKIIKGDFFGGASSPEFHGEGDYNQIAGDYVEDGYAYDASFNTKDNPESVVPQEQTKGKSPASPFPTGPTPELSPGSVVEGEFFAGSHHFTVGGAARFNAIKGSRVKTRSNRRSAPIGPTRPAPPTAQAAPPNYEQRETPVIKGNFFEAAHTAVFDGNHEFNSISGDMIQTKYTFEADKHDGYMDEDEAVVNAAPSAQSAIPKIIKGDFFTGASNLESHGEGDYNQDEDP